MFYETDSYHLTVNTGPNNVATSLGMLLLKNILGIRILVLGYEHAFRTLNHPNGNGNGIAEHAADFRRMAAGGASATVLAPAENLPKIVDKSSISISHDVE